MSKNNMGSSIDGFLKKKDIFLSSLQRAALWSGNGSLLSWFKLEMGELAQPTAPIATPIFQIGQILNRIGKGYRVE